MWLRNLKLCTFLIFEFWDYKISYLFPVYFKELSNFLKCVLFLEQKENQKNKKKLDKGKERWNERKGRKRKRKKKRGGGRKGDCSVLNWKIPLLNLCSPVILNNTEKVSVMNIMILQLSSIKVIIAPLRFLFFKLIMIFSFPIYPAFISKKLSEVIEKCPGSANQLFFYCAIFQKRK